jgi:uncharacterized phage protein (TIGR01671 family)
MNRKLKFRAWYKPDFETKDGPLKFVQKELKDGLYFVCEKDNEVKYPFNIPFMDDNWIIQGSTGAKDANGLEIFEGDIINLEYDAFFSNSLEFGEIMCLPGSYVKRASEIKRVGFRDSGFSYSCKIGVKGNYKMTVIGNIFQNKDLLSLK